MDAAKLWERKRKRRSVQGAIAVARWRSEAEQRFYSSRLLEALRQVRRSSPSAVPQGRTVKEAADRILAATARGRTRWSRAILLSARRTVRVRALRNRRRAAARGPASVSTTVQDTAGAGSGSNLAMAPLERKVKILGSLVPGGRKLTLPGLLLESMDYIAALEMQVRAMSNLANRLSNVGVREGVPSSAGRI